MLRSTILNKILHGPKASQVSAVTSKTALPTLPKYMNVVGLAGPYSAAKCITKSIARQRFKTLPGALFVAAAF